MSQTYSEDELRKSELALELPVLPDGPSDGIGAWFSAQRVLGYFVLGVILIWLLSGFYHVGVGDVAVVERLGQYVKLSNGHTELLEAGLHYHLPWPIDEVYVVPLERQHLLEVTDFNTSPAVYAGMKRQFLRSGQSVRVFDAIFDPYIITGDENVLHAQIAVQYHIENPVEYLNRVYQPPGAAPGTGRMKMIRALAAHVLIRKLAGTTVDEALYSGKATLDAQLYNPTIPGGGMQAPMNRLGIGIQVEKVQLGYVHWPQAVDQAFTAVLNARQQAESEVQQARQMANHATTLARGQADAIINRADTYANRVVQKSTGEMREFSQIFTQYQKNPRVVSLKLLSDTLGRVMGSVARVFIVQPHQKLLLTLPPPRRRIIVPPSPLGTAGSP